MTDHLQWPAELVGILECLEKFAGAAEQGQSKGTMTTALSYGFRAEASLDGAAWQALQDLHAAAGGKPIRFSLPGEGTPRQGVLQAPEVLATAPDGRRRVIVTIGGGHPMA